MPLVSGKTYVFYNHQSGTALDLDIASSNVQGWTYLERPNQHWKVTSHSDRGGLYWTIQNVQNGAYLAYELPPKDGSRVRCSLQSFHWKFSQQGGNEVYKIDLFQGRYRVDLAEGGKSADGTPVQLWTGTDGDNQKWDVQDA